MEFLVDWFDDCFENPGAAANGFLTADLRE